MTGAKSKKKPAPKKRKVGRPSLYTEPLAAKICRRLAEGESLRAICADKAMPSAETVRRWLLDNEDFCAQYVRAREVQADRFAEEILEIADDASGDWAVDKDGKKTLDHEHVQRSRLRVDTRKWLMARMAPKKYGDKLQHTGEGGGPIRVRPDLSKLTDEELNVLERILGRATDAR
jgi:hypothetical protein